MQRSSQGGILAVCIALACAGSARADGWCYPVYSSVYYYPAYYPTFYYVAARPVYYYVLPAPTVPPVAVVRPAATGISFAQPLPAPPSQTKEPPLDKKQLKPPTVTESKSSMGANQPDAALDVDGNDVCRVGFWNVTGRDVKLTINGKAYTIARDRNLTLTLGRAFHWQLEAREPNTEIVPKEQLSHEIVIR